MHFSNNAFTFSVTSAFINPASVSSLTGFKTKTQPLPKPMFLRRRLCVTEKWLRDHSYQQGFAAASLLWRHPSPGLYWKGRVQLERARCRHRCFLLVKSSWKPACKQQENPGPCEQEAQLQISVMPLPPPFLKRKMGRKPSRALNLFLYFSCKGVISPRS